ncbi:MAG: N-acetyltransferase [Deltaproteobacteria bacterium]|nr:N-acetyltransferase [Deltaproteobacteria bacterium]
MITIREEQHQDRNAIREVNIQAFGQNQEADLVDKIRLSCNDLISLVALIQNTIVGHICFSPVTIETKAKKTIRGMGLAPMAVLPAFQRQGVGTELVRGGIARVRKKGFPFIIVLGHASYYPRFGFEPASRYEIRCEWDVPDSAFMILLLDESQMRESAGLARYLPEFAEST